jgi:GNAT superfamily N-acetyltransferase
LLRELGYVNLDIDTYGVAFDRVLVHPEMHVLVAQRDDAHVVGFLALSHRPQLRLGGTLVTIDELVVKSGVRGSGVGRALLERAKSVAASLGALRLELSTNRTRESYARQFYEKNGFVEVNSSLMRTPQTL